MSNEKLSRSLNSLFHLKQFLIVLIIVLLSSCIDNSKIDIRFKDSKKKDSESLNITVSNIQVIDHQIVITGTNLLAVNNFNVKEGNTTNNLQIESQTSTSIVANTLSNVSFAAGKIFDFILSNASAASTFTVNFSLCNSMVGDDGFDCSNAPTDKDVLSYDQTNKLWTPRSINGLSYRGAWDASGNLPAITTTGDYYIVSVAGSGYSVGDWAVYNGSGFDKVDNSTAIVNVFGRTGAITANKNDYVLTKMGDVDLITTPPSIGNVLKYDGSNWVPGTVSGGGGGSSGTVTVVSGSAPLSVTNNSTTPAITIAKSDTATDGYLSSTDWNIFNSKQTAITAGTTTQYFRGDKTFQALNTDAVVEGANLYFTNARVLGLGLTGFSATNSVITAADSIVTAFGKVQGQINNLTSGGSNYLIKNGTDSITGVVSVGTTGLLQLVYTPVGANDATNKSYVDSVDLLKINKAGDTMSGVLTLESDLKIKGAANYVTIRGHATSAAYNLILPQTAGTAGYVLQTDGSGNLSWINPSATTTGTGTVTSASIVDGAIVDVDISASAAIAQSKVANLTTDLGNKVSTTLSSGNILIGNASNAATSIAVSGDATLSNTGVLTLKNTGTAGTFTSVTTDAQGRITGGTNPAVVGSISVNAPIANSGTASAPVLGIPVATTSVDGHLAATDWTIFNNKQAAITKSSTLDVLKLRIYGPNATNYVELSTSTTANRSFVFPDSNGSSGNVLSTDGSGVLSWIAPTTSAVSSVFTRTGAVVAVAGDYTAAQITNTPSGGISAITTQAAINELDTEKQSIASLASDVLGTVLAGLSVATNSVIQNTTDTILTALGKLQAQISSLNTNKLSKNSADSITSIITVSGAGDLIIPSTPAGMTSAVNKAYVDSVVSSPSVTCPTGYVLVPGNAAYFPNQFCVAKYEMKDDGYGTAVSTAAGLPWVMIDRPTARGQCQALGSGYDMISNDQWQTIARNIASVASNWSTGIVSSGELNRGNSDNDPGIALAAVMDDNDPCNGTNDTCTASTWNGQRRTHVLSNGNTIWDFSGNVYSWLTNNSSSSNGANGYMSTMSGGDIRQTRYGPSAFCEAPSVSPYCGMGNGVFFGITYAVARGGYWSSDLAAGVFNTRLSYDATTTNTFIGFRCVFVP